MAFKEGEKEHFVEIEVLYDGQREMREAFTVHMKPDDNMVAEIQVRRRPRGMHEQMRINKFKPRRRLCMCGVQYCRSTQEPCHVSLC